jgi:hypothetical protein
VRVSSGQNSFVPDNNGTKLFCPRFCPGDKNDTFFLGGPPPAVGDDDAVAGQQLSIIAASADHSAAAAVSAGDNDDNNDEANEPSPRAGTDADEGGRGQPDDRLASTWQELASYDANTHGGRTTSSNHVTNEGGGAAGNAPGRVYRQQSAKKRQQ